MFPVRGVNQGEVDTGELSGDEVFPTVKGPCKCAAVRGLNGCPPLGWVMSLGLLAVGRDVKIEDRNVKMLLRLSNRSAF
jgi:hypothetical protein